MLGELMESRGMNETNLSSVGARYSAAVKILAGNDWIIGSTQALRGKHIYTRGRPEWELSLGQKDWPHRAITANTTRTGRAAR